MAYAFESSVVSVPISDDWTDGSIAFSLGVCTVDLPDLIDVYDPFALFLSDILFTSRTDSEISFRVKILWPHSIALSGDEGKDG